MAPVAFYKFDIKTQFIRYALPQGGEVPGLEHQYLVTGRQGVDQSSLPGTSA